MKSFDDVRHIVLSMTIKQAEKVDKIMESWSEDERRNYDLWYDLCVKIKEDDKKTTEIRAWWGNCQSCGRATGLFETKEHYKFCPTCLKLFLESKGVVFED